MKESAWALTNLSNPFQHRAAFARPLLLQGLRGRERENVCVCVCVCVCAHRSVSSGKLGCAKDFWESLGGETKHSGCSVWNSILCWRAIIYPLGVWVTYRLCVTKGCELQDRVITEHCRASWACVSCHTFPLKWKTSVLIWLCIIILNIEAGVPIWHPASTAVFRVTERCLRIIDFVVQQRKTQGKASPHHGPS